MKIAPSLLSADFGKLQQEIEMLNQSRASVIHVDVMDGRFVPNISFGFPIMQVLKKWASIPLDVHLMIEEPEKYALAFAEAGAHWVSFHVEACRHSHRLLKQLKEAGIKAGIALNPQTAVFSVQDLYEEVDFVNLMSVNPGFGGQKFIARTLHKIAELNAIRQANNLSFEIEIDGGVGPDNLEQLAKAGADIAVAGNAVFASPNPLLEIERMAQNQL